MMAIHAVPAFKDNYLWVRRGRRPRRGGRPGRRGARAALPRRARARAHRDARHPPPQRPRRRARAPSRRAGSARCSGRRASRSRASPAGLRGGDRIRVPGIDLAPECSTFRATPRATSRYCGGGHRVLRRHALRLRLRAPLRGHARADGRFARQARRACPATRASTARTNTRWPTSASPRRSSRATRGSPRARRARPPCARGDAHAFPRRSPKSSPPIRSCAAACPESPRPPRGTRAGPSPGPVEVFAAVREWKNAVPLT